MADQKENNITISGRVPRPVKEDMDKAIKKGHAANESDFIRKAVIREINELRKGGLL